MPECAAEIRNAHHIAALCDQARRHRAHGRYGEAGAYYDQALAALDEAARDIDPADEPTHDRVARIRLRLLSDLGDLDRLRGQYHNAEQVLRDVLARYEQLAGPDDVETALACVNLGVVCKYLGRYAEAERLYQRALRILESATVDQTPALTGSTSSRWSSAMRMRCCFVFFMGIGPSCESPSPRRDRRI